MDKEHCKMSVNFINIKIIILLNICFTHAFRSYGIGNGYRFLIREMTSTAQSDFASSPVETLWIEQSLDHFNDTENRTWQMRYFENLQFYKQGGPIFLFLGGEGEASPVFLRTGITYELAQDTNGAMYGSEHRYYGQSMPLANTVTENLKYLSSQQALADAAFLLKTIKSTPKFNDSKVVVVGGSYPGNLAAWMKLIYPDMIDAAIASSAPVLAKKDFYEYLEAVSDDYEQQGPVGCHDKIAEIFQRYEELFKSDAGIRKLKVEEKICEDNDMSKMENMQLFFLDKTSEFMSRAQYGSPQHIAKHCDRLTNTSRVVSSRQNFEDEPSFWREESQCYDYDFYNMIDEMKETDWITSWIYQTCTEFGYYQSTTSDNQPFTKNVPPELYYKMCTNMFGPEFDETFIDEAVRKTNEYYKGLAPNVSHVVFVNGDMDPWSRLGVLEDVSYEAPAKVIARASHCRDLFSNRKGDPEELKEARGYIKYLIKSWLGFGDEKLLTSMKN